MRLSIGALSRLSGVSVRALHHYDQIGLLQPSEVAESGYRYYDSAAIERLWQILFYRELDFPLNEISQILSSPAFDRERALTEHRSLLLQKRERLDRLIELVSNAMKGETTMEFQPFDTSEIDALREQYAEEAKARWGNTEAYRESTKRAAKWTEADKARLQKQSDEIFSAFAALVGTGSADARVQALVTRWKAFISERYYNCTDEILAGMGQMYVADERFTKNIDKYGAGTAKLMSEAIAVYCGK
ncbi:MAG: MerR family transcriptional regulator [Eubacteriales bacterium]|nr:MerR family transcriptional regulator [Eubacteriales bacterium]